MKRKQAFFAVIVVMAFVYFYPRIYTEYLKELVNTALYFLFPAVFPSIFLISMLLDTEVIQDLGCKHPRLAGFLMTAILSFGGTPILLATSGELQMEKDQYEKLAVRHIAPSFSFIFFLLREKMSGGAAVLIAAMIFAIPLVTHLLFPLDIRFKKGKTTSYSLIDSAQDSAVNGIRSLSSLVLMIALLGALKPLVLQLLPQGIAPFIQGVLEYTSGSIELTKQLSRISSLGLAFVLIFNGLSSILAIKKMRPDLDASRIFAKKTLWALLWTLPLGSLIFEALEHA